MYWIYICIDRAQVEHIAYCEHRSNTWHRLNNVHKAVASFPKILNANESCNVWRTTRCCEGFGLCVVVECALDDSDLYKHVSHAIDHHFISSVRKREHISILQVTRLTQHRWCAWGYFCKILNMVRDKPDHDRNANNIPQCPVWHTDQWCGIHRDCRSHHASILLRSGNLLTMISILQDFQETNQEYWTSEVQ